MPLKSQDYIHRFFVENKGKEFIGYYQGDMTTEIDRKVRRWHLFPEHFKDTLGGLFYRQEKSCVPDGFVCSFCCESGETRTLILRKGHSG